MSNSGRWITDDCEPLPDYLNLTLTPSNPILHTTRLMTLFKDYVPGKIVYSSVPLFYEEWSDETTELLFKCDAEVQGLCHELKVFDLSEVKSLRLIMKVIRFRDLRIRSEVLKGSRDYQRQRLK